MGDLRQLTSACLSPDNALRERAEKRLEAMRRGEPDAYLSRLCSVVGSSHDLQARVFLCVLLRQDVGPRSPVWRGSSQKAKDGVKGMLLALLKNEENKAVRKHVCEAAGRLASHTVIKGTWKALLPALDSMCKSPHSVYLESSLHIAGILAENASHHMKPLFPTLHKVIIKALTSNDSSLQVVALRATESFIISLEGPAQSSFIKLLPNLFQVAAQFAAKGDDEPLQDYIDEIASLVTFRCQMFRPIMRDVIKLMAKVAGHADLEPGTRRMALSLVVELAKRDRTSVKQVKEMTSQIVPLAFAFMRRIDEDMSEWSQGIEERNEDEEDFCMGWDTLDHLATHLGGASILGATWPLIQKALASKSWLDRHAAISATSALIPGCQKVMSERLGDLLAMVAKRALHSEEHVRVRWAAVNCIGRMCVLFSDEIHEAFALPTLKCLIRAVNSRDHVRLAASAALCLVDYCRGMEGEQLQPHADTILGALRKLLGVNARPAQIGSLSAVSAVASTIEAGFRKYYGAFMPGVMKLLTESKGEGAQKLKSKAIECVGAIAAAVGPEQFRPQFKPVMEYLLKTQRNLGADDPQVNAILECSARICQCMGKDFIPYMHMVIPPLLKAAASSDGAFMQDGDDDPSDREGFETVEFAVRGVGNKRLLVNSAILQEKSMACHMLYQYASELKEGFYPYVEKTAKVMVPLMKYRYHESVRVAAVESIPSLLECLKLREETGKVTQLFNFALLPYLKAIMHEGDVGNLIGILHSFSDSIDFLPEPMEAKAIFETHQALGFVLSESNRRRLERLSEYKNADDEIKQEIEEENEQEDEMIGYVGSVIKSIVDLSKAHYLDLFFKGIMHKLMWGYLAPECSDGQHTAALIAYCNIVEQAGATASKLAEKFLPICLCYSGNTNTNVRQAAVYGVGVCAVSLGGKGFARYANGALKTLIQIITSKNARNDTFGESTDNAISSVGKICKTQLSTSPGIVKDVLPMWLSWLPCRHDEEEGPVVHAMLLKFLEDRNSPIYGKASSNLAKILSVIAEISDSEMVNNETQRGISNFVRRVSSGLGQQKMDSLLNVLPHELRAKLNS